MAECLDQINKPRRSRSKRFFTSCFGSSNMDIDKDGSSRVSQSLKVEKEEGVDGYKKRKKRNKSLARVLKAVFFETLMVRKARTKKHVRDRSKEDSTSTGSSTRKDNNFGSTKGINSPKSLSSLSIIPTPSPSQFSRSPYSLSTCSSLTSSSSIKSNSRLLMVMGERNSSLHRSGHVKAIKGSYSRVNSPLYFLLIAILIFIFLGKIYAIFCTSTCLYFVPRWGSNPIPPNNGIGFLEIDIRKSTRKGFL